MHTAPGAEFCILGSLFDEVVYFEVQEALKGLVVHLFTYSSLY